MLSHAPKTREYTGPNPYSVALMEKGPSNKPRDYLIRERHRDEQQRQSFLDQKEYQTVFDLKNEWEKQTNRTFKKNEIQRKVEMKLFEDEMAVEERKNRLGALLDQEQQEYVAELEAKFAGETQTQKLAQMRQRAKELARKREEERQKIVHEKTEQRWRGECEELRSVLSRRHQDQVCQARQGQIDTKQKIAAERRGEDSLYSQLWKQDAEVKAKREEDEALGQIARNKQTLAVLDKQVSERQAQNMLKLREIELDAQRLKEEQKLRIQESAEKEAATHSQRQRYRDDLAKHRMQREQLQTHWRKTELDIENKILSDARKAVEDEAIFTSQLRGQKIQYEKGYKDYIAQQRQHEADRQTEMDRLYMEDQKREWEQRDEIQKAQKKARQSLLEDVLHTREKQLQFREMTRKEEEEENRKERARIISDVEKFHQLETERLRGVASRNKEVQGDLIAQMEALEEQRKQQKSRDAEDYQVQLGREREYQQRIIKALQQY